MSDPLDRSSLRLRRKGGFPKPRRRHPLRTATLVLCTALLAAYCVFTGPRNLAQYPPRETSPYKLPWRSGVTRLCSQSNRGIVSHHGWQEFAYDFNMPVGAEVCAARNGTVVGVEARYDRHGWHAPNNSISIDHGDGTVGRYLHIKQGGNLIRVGDIVSQGQPIALSGNVGRSLGPHLHFHVISKEERRSIPISFVDVPKHRGIPRLGFWYTPQ